MPDGDAAPSRLGAGTPLRGSSLAWNVSGAAAAFDGSGCDEDAVAHAAIANPTTTGKVRLILIPPLRFADSASANIDRFEIRSEGRGLPAALHPQPDRRSRSARVLRFGYL